MNVIVVHVGSVGFTRIRFQTLLPLLTRICVAVWYKWNNQENGINIIKLKTHQKLLNGAYFRVSVLIACTANHTFLVLLMKETMPLSLLCLCINDK